ncbi:MAG: DEAD/DEAH box helicase [Gemmatimonadota bacterium]|nr:DEAD/DEAH box helicase [Gemmatimonadota bacterium]MDH3422850.1 DEAD/DEAH box helicase [Gemmatimonadota bacterium]
MAIPEGFPLRLPKEALAGVDGLDPEPPRRAPPPPTPLTLGPDARAKIRAEIARAGGREVCFLATVDQDRVVHQPRAVARGSFAAVLVAARDAPEGGVMLHNHPSGDLEPSEADMGVAGQLYEQGLGTAIVDNGADRLYVVVEPPTPRLRVSLEAGALEDVLSPGGALAERHAGYEDRPGQREMLREVVARFNDGGVAILEAGTGTGKSLAYLIPAALWARENRERTIVSTNTINLQEQLAQKDLPLLKELVGDISWALVKGRGNYVSIRRALLASESQVSLFEDDRSDEMARLLEWMRNTEDGSLSDLSFSPAEDTWEEVRSDPDICLRSRCPHFQECFYQQSRRRAAAADLLVVNHHLLFTDLAVRRVTQNYTQSAVLPAYRHVILDEAHNVEDAATSHLGVEVTRRGLFRALSRLDKRGRGILTAVHESLGGTSEGPALRERVENRVRPALSRALATMEGLVERIEPLAPAEEGAVRLGPSGIGEPAESTEVQEALAGTLQSFGILERELAELRARLEIVEELAERLEGRILDLRSVERRLAAASHGLRLVLAPGDEADAYVRWMDSRGRGRRANLVLGAAPIALGEMLRESLFERADSVVLTSATLSTRKRFDFLRSRLGLAETESSSGDEPLEVRERIILSPFDFASRTLLCVPTDLPAPGRGDPDFQEATARVVVELAEMSGGGIFVLFTAHSALRSVAGLLRQAGVDQRWPLYVQGESDRFRLLAGFVEARHGILLGTTSFWEGVDVPGEPLRGLVIQKLPFRVPTEPITAARMEAIEAAGGDSFRDFMLPQAAIRLKQGFGRLIRSHTDRGAVLVLDDRIVSKRYGRYLRDSLPDAPLVKGAWTDVRRRLAEFYAATSDGPSTLGTSRSAG